MSNDHPVFLIDGQNLFIRSYAAYPSMSANGYQMGGTIGFLKTMQRLITEFKPRAVCIAWEGGGSKKRRKIFPEYKLGRAPEKLNRFYGDDIPDTEINRQHQLITLIDILKHVPVYQIYAPDCEGDDIIAYLCNKQFRNKNKIIVSSDKDLYQLLDDTTRIYSLHRKNFVTKENLIEEYRISANNFALAKAICGDKGDNIPGIPGIGFKTLAKNISFLCQNDAILVDDLLKYSAANRDTSKVCKKIFENTDIVKRNWSLVYLSGSMIPVTGTTAIDNKLANLELKTDKKKIADILTREAIGNFNLDDFIFECRVIGKI